MRNKLLILSFLVVALAGCKKDYFDPDKLSDAADNLVWSPEFAIPLAYGSYTLEDVLNQTSEDAQSVVQIDQDNFVTLVYTGEIASLNASDVFIISDQATSSSFNSGVNIPLLPASDSLVVNYTLLESISVGANQIDSMRMNSGNFQVNINSTFKQDVKFELTFPTIIKNGQAVKEIVQLNYSGSTPVSGTATIDLSDALLILNHNSTTRNTIKIEVRAVVYGNGSSIASSDQIDINTNITDLDFAAVYGYLDVSNISTPIDSIPISVFSAAQGVGTFSITNPSIKFRFFNSIGVPLAIDFSQFKGLNTNTGVQNDLISSSALPSPLPIQSPMINQQGQILADSFTIGGSDLAQFINDQPNRLIYGIDLQTSSSANQSSFILDTSKLKVDATLEMPLEGSANVFGVYDTIAVSFQGLDSNNSQVDVDNLVLKSIVENEFPIDFAMQLYTADSLLNVTDSLLPSGTVIYSSNIDAAGELVSAGILNLDIVIDSSRTQSIETMQNIIIKASATTAGGGSENVKIYSDYKLDVRLGVKAKFSVNP